MTTAESRAACPLVWRPLVDKLVVYLAGGADTKLHFRPPDTVAVLLLIRELVRRRMITYHEETGDFVRTPGFSVSRVYDAARDVMPSDPATR